MDRKLLRLCATLAATAAIVAAPAAQAGSLSAADAARVRHVVATQLAALAAGDADGAFATATPAVRKTIGDPGRFMALVSHSWPMVRHPVKVSLQKPEVDDDDGSVIELVDLVDDHDRSWVALFLLERQPDASWRISGCNVAENPWLDT